MRRSPFVEVRFRHSRRRPLSAPVQVRVIQEEFRHDLAIITIRGSQASQKDFRTGTPVSLSWGYAPKEIEYFYGYVAYTQPSTRDNQVEVVCVAASLILKQPRMKVYSDFSVDQIVKDVAKLAMFSTDVRSHSRQWSRTIQSGDNTTWEFLVQISKKIGYTFYANKTELRCYSRAQKLSDRFIAPVFVRRKLASQTEIRNFIATEGDVSPAGGDAARREMYSLDPETLRIQHKTHSGQRRNRAGRDEVRTLFSQFESSRAESPGEARDLLEGASQEHRWALQAEVELMGSPHVTQNTPVHLQGLGGRDEGTWITERVEHTIRPRRDYWMKVKLGRDSYGHAGESPSQGRRVVRGDFSPSGSVQRPNSIFIPFDLIGTENNRIEFLPKISSNNKVDLPYGVWRATRGAA